MKKVIRKIKEEAGFLLRFMIYLPVIVALVLLAPFIFKEDSYEFKNKKAGD